jgi:hypothetical protein
VHAGHAPHASQTSALGAAIAAAAYSNVEGGDADRDLNTVSTGSSADSAANRTQDDGIIRANNSAQNNNDNNAGGNHNGSSQAGAFDQHGRLTANHFINHHSTNHSISGIPSASPDRRPNSEKYNLPATLSLLSSPDAVNYSEIGGILNLTKAITNTGSRLGLERSKELITLSLCVLF